LNINEKIIFIVVGGLLFLFIIVEESVELMGKRNKNGKNVG
jgi:hypothetical protein